MTTVQSIPQPAQLVPLRSVRASFEATADERAALAVDALAPINVDPMFAVTTMLGALDGVRSLRDAIVVHLPTFDLKAFDSLETYTCAFEHAHTRYLAASRPEEPLQALAERGMSVRETLRSDALALGHRGLIDEAPLDGLKGGPGFRNLAADLHLLAQIFRSAWAAVQGKTATTIAEIDEADLIADGLLYAIGDHQQPAAAVRSAAEDRTRAFTLFIRTYEATRRAARYLRWKEGDADQLVPSLHTSGTSRSGKSKDTDSKDTAPVATPPGVISPVVAPVAAPVAPLLGGDPFRH